MLVLRKLLFSFLSLITRALRRVFLSRDFMIILSIYLVDDIPVELGLIRFRMTYSALRDRLDYAHSHLASLHWLQPRRT